MDITYLKWQDFQSTGQQAFISLLNLAKDRTRLRNLEHLPQQEEMLFLLAYKLLFEREAQGNIAALQATDWRVKALRLGSNTEEQTEKERGGPPLFRWWCRQSCRCHP